MLENVGFNYDKVFSTAVINLSDFPSDYLDFLGRIRE
jgi:hypothetical protein